MRIISVISYQQLEILLGVPLLWNRLPVIRTTARHRERERVKFLFVRVWVCCRWFRVCIHEGGTLCMRVCVCCVCADGKMSIFAFSSSSFDVWVWQKFRRSYCCSLRVSIKGIITCLTITTPQGLINAPSLPIVRSLLTNYYVWGICKKSISKCYTKQQQLLS